MRIWSAPGPLTKPRRRWLVAFLALAVAALMVGILVAFGGDEGPVAAPTRATGSDDVLRGTPGPDDLVGGSGDDQLLGLAGPDRLDGGLGNDLLNGGRGRDILIGNKGDDRIEARDGYTDQVFCGLGFDTVVSSDRDDTFANCEVLDRDLPPQGGSVVQDDRSWTCDGPVNLDLVKINLTMLNADAVYLRTNCSGYIARVEIDTATADGIKVNAVAPVAHDLVIGGGYIRCHGRTEGTHQDGIQAMGGERITFRNLEISCSSGANAQFFVGAALGGFPTDVVCHRCVLGSGAGTTLLIQDSIGSGARGTLVCPGRFRPVNIGSRAERPVNVGNRLLDADDPRCAAS
jgi:hypothetical protein